MRAGMRRNKRCTLSLLVLGVFLALTLPLCTWYCFQTIPLFTDRFGTSLFPTRFVAPYLLSAHIAHTSTRTPHENSRWGYNIMPIQPCFLRIWPKHPPLPPPD